MGDLLGRLKAALDRLGERRPWVGVALQMHRRYGELHGNHLAASITLQAFLSLFPLLLVSIAVLGFVAAGTVDVAGRVIGELGLTGDGARAVNDAVTAATETRRAASVVGLIGLLWSGLGLVGALQYGYDQVWMVKERGWKDKLFGLAWLAGAGVLFTLGTAITSMLSVLPWALTPLAFLAAMFVSFVVWLWTSRVLPNRAVGWTALVPGAILGAIGLEALKAIGAFLVPRMVASSSALYGSIGTIFAILAWLLIFSRLVIYTAVLDVVLYEREHGTDTEQAQVPSLPADDNAERAYPIDQPA